MVTMQGGVFGAVATPPPLGGCPESRPRPARAARRLAIEAAGMTKRFGTFTALDDVSRRSRPADARPARRERRRQVDPGEMHLGYYRPTRRFLGRWPRGRDRNPQRCHALGLGMVYQHFTLVPAMTVAENLVMSRRRAGRDRLARSTGARRLHGRACRSRCRSSRSAAGRRRAAEDRNPQAALPRAHVLVLDEPTSVLTPQEADEVLGLVRGLAGGRAHRRDHHPQAAGGDGLRRRGHRAAPRPPRRRGRVKASPRPR